MEIKSVYFLSHSEGDCPLVKFTPARNRQTTRSNVMGGTGWFLTLFSV